MPEKIGFDAQCPKCGKFTHHGYAEKTLRGLLLRKEPITCFCEHCRQGFEQDKDEKAKLANSLKERLGI